MVVVEVVPYHQGIPLQTGTLWLVTMKFYTRELVSRLLPIFEVAPTSKAWRGDIKWWKSEELKLYYD
ncbi:hypothetical protein PanWU01x14_149670, partial [Parasponia andersonii]